MKRRKVDRGSGASAGGFQQHVLRIEDKRRSTTIFVHALRDDGGKMVVGKWGQINFGSS